MINITYKALSSIAPLNLQYNFNKNEELKTGAITYSDGLSFTKHEALKEFQDIAITRNTCFVLTTSISLSTALYNNSKNIKIGELPGSLVLQPRNQLSYYVGYNASNFFNLQSNTNTIFYISPVGNNEVEIFVNSQYLQVDSAYPYIVRLNSKSLDIDEIQRQRFKIYYQNDNTIMFATSTDTGYRFLCCDKNDNIMRATGVILNSSIVNDYIFKCLNVTISSLNNNFIPNNSWVTYYLQPELTVTQNETLDINKDFKNITTNLLLDFPIQKSFGLNNIDINIANLKTNITTTGNPAPVDNNAL
jgi:hypothetical protein